MNERTDTPSVGVHFLEFAIQFFNLAKCQYQQQNQVRANTAGFHALVLLSHPQSPSPTMSELAEQLGITKQQLTKLVNDLEDKELVSRRHDSKNRRLVYLDITPKGLTSLEELKKDMLRCTVSGLRGYSLEELKQLDDCLVQLSKLLEKFQTEKTLL